MAAILVPTVQGMPWEGFEPWFRKRWRQGEHVFVVGPTGYGKTTIVVQLLAERRHALALDVKGGDRTLAKLQTMGFERTRWPLGQKAYDRMERGEPGRFIIGWRPKDIDETPKLEAMIRTTLRDVFGEGGWSVYVDELKLAASAKMANMGTLIERNLIAGRDRGVSIITSCQTPSWVPRNASDQASWMFVFPTRDRDVVSRLAEMAGRPKEEIAGALRGLGSKEDHMVLVVGTDPQAPMIVTRALPI